MATMSRELERGLISAGVEREQAAAIADEFDERLSDVATKADVRQAVDDLREEVRYRFEDMQRLQYWILALLSAMIVGGFGGLIFALAS